MKPYIDGVDKYTPVIILMYTRHFIYRHGSLPARPPAPRFIWDREINLELIKIETPRVGFMQCDSRMITAEYSPSAREIILDEGVSMMLANCPQSLPLNPSKTCCSRATNTETAPQHRPIKCPAFRTKFKVATCLVWLMLLGYSQVIPRAFIVRLRRPQEVHNRSIPPCKYRGAGRG